MNYIRKIGPLSMVHAPSRRASTLLFALLVMSTILIAAVSIGQIAMIEIQLVKANNETVVATYSAESALEQGAWRVRNTSDTLAALTASKNFTNGASYSRVASSTEGSLILRPLALGQTRGFDFYDPDKSEGPNYSGKRESVKIYIDACDADHSDWIELGYQSVDTNLWNLGTFTKVRYHCPDDFTGNTTNGWTKYNNAPVADGVTAYRLYIRYVQGTTSALHLVTVTGCTADNGGGTCSLPGRVDITATGTYRSATRLMDLTMPRVSPITGIFDYGAFSECQIIKDPTGTPIPGC
jgi:hypothetical protein